MYQGLEAYLRKIINSQLEVRGNFASLEPLGKFLKLLWCLY